MILADLFFNGSQGSQWQTIAALAVVAIAFGWLVLRGFAKTKSGAGCGGGACSAVSKDVKKLQAHVKAQQPTLVRRACLALRQMIP